MTDGELRGHILESLYKHRSEGRVPATEEAAQACGISLDEIVRVTKQLEQKGLAEWSPGPLGCRNQGLAGYAAITAAGVDVVEKNVLPPFAIIFDSSMNVNVTNSNGVQVGQGNSQQTTITLSDLKKLIEDHSSKGADKSKVKAIWNSLLSHPITASVLGGLVSTLKFDQE